MENTIYYGEIVEVHDRQYQIHLYRFKRTLWFDRSVSEYDMKKGDSVFVELDADDFHCISIKECTNNSIIETRSVQCLEISDKE